MPDNNLNSVSYTDLDTENKKYGFLTQPSVKLHRKYFIEMTRLIGIYVYYRYPMKGKRWTTYDELDSNYVDPIKVGCIFDQHPSQQTLKKIGWMSELQEGSSIIHVPYDLENLQQGCLFIVPSGLDDGAGRVFRVVRLTNEIVYPASITCEIVPEYQDKYIPDVNNHENNSNMNVLNDEEIYKTWNQ